MAAPDRYNKQTNQGNIGITIGHRLIRHLHNPDNWNQSAKIPKPTNQKIGVFSEILQNQHCNGSQNKSCQRKLPQRNFQVWIKNSEVGRPEQFLDIQAIGNNGVTDTAQMTFRLLRPACAGLIYFRNWSFTIKKGWILFSSLFYLTAFLIDAFRDILLWSQSICH